MVAWHRNMERTLQWPTIATIEFNIYIYYIHIRRALIYFIIVNRWVTEIIGLLAGKHKTVDNIYLINYPINSRMTYFIDINPIIIIIIHGRYRMGFLGYWYA